MYCQRCGTENPQQAKACICCGASLPLSSEHAGQPAVPPPHSFIAAGGSTIHGPAVADGGNTSGQPAIPAVPESTSGICLGGLAPFGLFALYNGMFGWGIAGLLINLLLWPLYIVYAIVIAVIGRREAWRNRRFADLADFEQTMQAWNIAGVVSCVLMIVLYVIWANLAGSFEPPPPGTYSGG